MSSRSRAADDSEPRPLVALTGGTGFLGSHIADTLLAHGYSVRVAVRATSDLVWLKDKPLDIQVVDLGNAGDCRKLVAGATAVIHCAGRVSAPTEEEYFEANTEPTELLLEAVRHQWNRSEGTFLLVSSLAAHGPASLERPATEESPSRPVSAYGRSKLAAEKLVLEGDYGFRTIVLRPPSLYGPRDREFLPLFKAALRGWTVQAGRRMQGLSLVDGRDAAAAAVALVSHPEAAGTFFVDDGHAGYDWNEIQDILAVTTGRRVRRLTLSLGLVRALARMASLFGSASELTANPDRLRDLDVDGWACDGSRLQATVGFSPSYRAFEGFRETLAFYRKWKWL